VVKGSEPVGALHPRCRLLYLWKVPDETALTFQQAIAGGFFPVSLWVLIHIRSAVLDYYRRSQRGAGSDPQAPAAVP
jgi:hypothetical protein